MAQPINIWLTAALRRHKVLLTARWIPRTFRRFLGSIDLDLIDVATDKQHPKSGAGISIAIGRSSSTSIVNVRRLERVLPTLSASLCIVEDCNSLDTGPPASAFASMASIEVLQRFRVKFRAAVGLDCMIDCGTRSACQA